MTVTKVNGSLLEAVGRAPVVLDRIDAPVDRSEVRRYIGYPRTASPNPRIEGMLERWISEAEPLATPKGTFRIFPVLATGKRFVRVEGPTGDIEFNGAIGEFLGPIEFVAVFISTAGPNVEKLAGQMLAKGDVVAGLIVNAVGSERAETAEMVLTDRLKELVHPRGMGLSLPYSPGYCGMALTEQRKLFGLMKDGADIGVSLTPDCLMQPLKSVSGLIGIGPALAIEQHGSPCDRCDLKNCNMRR